jgi:hypothetical protein
MTFSLDIQSVILMERLGGLTATRSTLTSA